MLSLHLWTSRIKALSNSRIWQPKKNSGWVATRQGPYSPQNFNEVGSALVWLLPGWVVHVYSLTVRAGDQVRGRPLIVHACGLRSGIIAPTKLVLVSAPERENQNGEKLFRRKWIIPDKENF